MAALWKQAARWLNQVGVLPSNHPALGAHAQVFDFALALQDGTVLCHCLNKIMPGCITTLHEKPDKQFLKMQNINNFLEALQAHFKIKEKDLFTADELYYAAKFDKVIHTLSILSKSQRAGLAGFRFFPQEDTRPDPVVDDTEEAYSNLEDLVGQSLTLADAATDVVQIYTGTEDDDYEDIYGAIRDAITDQNDEVYQSAIYGGAPKRDDAMTEDIYSSTVYTPEQKRDHVLQELLDTERSYVKILDMIIRDFKGSLTAAKSITKSDVTTVFGNIEDLLAAHTALLEELEKQMESKSGRIISIIFTRNKERLKCYGQFCCMIPEALERIEELNSRKDTSKALDEAKAKSGQKFPLKDLLNVPMQRILKYPLLLKELTKHTPPNHPDKVDLSTALAIIEDLARYINDTKKDFEHMRKVVEAVKGNNRSSAELGRLIRDGDLYYRLRPSKERIKNRYLFLFFNGILITKQHKGFFNCKSFIEFNVKQSMIEEHTLEREDQPSEKHVHAFAIRDGSTTHVFVAKSLPVKRKWMQAVKDALQAFKDSKTGPPQIAPRTATLKPARKEEGSFKGPSAPLPPVPDESSSPAPSTTPGKARRSYEQWAPPASASSSSSEPLEPVSAAETDDSQWFAGRLPRHKAEKIMAGMPSGAFMVRESDSRPGDYSLSIMFENEVKHIKINRHGKKYDVAPDSVAFDTLFELVAHFEKHSLNRHFPGMDTTLRFPFKQFLAKPHVASANSQGIGRARARHAYQARSHDELTFERGAEIIILSTNEEDAGWWRGTLQATGETGIFPANFVQQL